MTLAVVCAVALFLIWTSLPLVAVLKDKPQAVGVGIILSMFAVTALGFATGFDKNLAIPKIALGGGLGGAVVLWTLVGLFFLPSKISSVLNLRRKRKERERDENLDRIITRLEQVLEGESGGDARQ